MKSSLFYVLAAILFSGKGKLRYGKDRAVLLTAFLVYGGGVFLPEPGLSLIFFYNACFHCRTEYQLTQTPQILQRCKSQPYRVAVFCAEGGGGALA